jgi:EmrB/QacA subfamily drug resistance transporter
MSPSSTPLATPTRGAAPLDARSQAEGYPRRWWTLGVLCLSLLVISLDNTILNVALPTLVRELGASSSQLQWMVDAYVLVFAGLLLTMGSLGDRFGRRLTLFAGFAIFGIFSLVAAWSGTADRLIAARALMGVGGALIMPSTLSILTNVFPAHERGKAIAIWASTAGLGVPLGPVLGGWLLEHFWWGSVFLINAPLVVIALIAAFLLVPESRDPEAAHLDPAGALLSMAGLTALLYGIIEAPNRGWTDGLILACFGVAAVVLTAFALWELRNPRPMLDTRLFKNARFSGASLAVALVFFALFGSMFFLTQYLQFVKGYTTLGAGLRVTPVVLGILSGTGLSTRLVPKVGTKLVVAAGLAIVAAALAYLSTATVTSGYSVVAIGLILIGFGMGLAMAPATDSIMGAVPKANAGVGSAVNDTTRQVGGALGVAILGSLLSTAYTNKLDTISSQLPPQAAAAANSSIGGALEVARRAGGPQGQQLADFAKRAFVDGMQQALLVGAGVALLGALIALLLLPAREPAAESDDPAAAEVETRQPLETSVG